MVEWSIAAFRAAGPVGSIVVACPPGHAHDLAAADVAVVDGGATRAESVSNALLSVETELVAIHDAARPLVTPELIEATVATLERSPGAAGAIAAAPVTDTIKWANGPWDSTKTALTPSEGVNADLVIEATLDRGRLWAAQTPQVFRVEALREALAAEPARVAEATDESMLVEASGGTVLVRPAPPENFKVTTALDLKLAELLLGGR
jgi:2-C-methyl-D-erythritol 4-phosphate cytidylyltransferase